MRSKAAILCVIGLLLLSGLNGSAKNQPSDFSRKIDDDTIEIAIEYTTAYPGWHEWIVVSMKNPVPVAGYQLFFQLSSSHAIRFSCFDEYCAVDTTDCSQDSLSYISCACQGEGDAAQIVGLGSPGEWIPPSSDHVCLFKIEMDACCIPDADTLRNAYVLLVPELSSVADTLGNLLPFRYYMGELYVQWRLPGDANGDKWVDAGDLICMIGYVFLGCKPPCVCEAADCDGNGSVDMGDVIYLINYFFLGSPAPIEGGASCWHEECRP